MAKKYVPSGYQIINIIIDNSEGNYFVVDSEDKTTLIKVLENVDISVIKPILLHCATPDYNLTCFPLLEDYTLRFNSGDYAFAIALVNRDLEVTVSSL